MRGIINSSVNVTPILCFYEFDLELTLQTDRYPDRFHKIPTALSLQQQIKTFLFYIIMWKLQPMTISTRIKLMKTKPNYMVDEKETPITMHVLYKYRPVRSSIIWVRLSFNKLAERVTTKSMIIFIVPNLYRVSTSYKSMETNIHS